MNRLVRTIVICERRVRKVLRPPLCHPVGKAECMRFFAIRCRMSRWILTSIACVARNYEPVTAVSRIGKCWSIILALSNERPGQSSQVLKKQVSKSKEKVFLKQLLKPRIIPQNVLQRAPVLTTIVDTCKEGEYHADEDQETSCRKLRCRWKECVQ